MTEDNKIELYKGGVLSTVRKLTATVASPSSPEPDADVDLNYVVRVLREHYRTVLVSGIALMLAALVVSLFMKPVYRSQATIEIKEATPDIENLEQLQTRNMAPNNVVMTEVETEIGILKSDSLARKVINEVILAKQPKSKAGISRIFSGAWHAVAHWYAGSDSNDSSSQGESNDAGSGLAENVSHGIVALRTRREHEIALRALRENEQRFRATFEQAAVGVCHIAPDGRFLRVNRKFCTIVGMDQDALLDTRMDSLVHPEDDAVVREQRRMLLQGEAATFSRELRLLRPDGRLVWVNRTVSVVREAVPNYLIAVFQDVTEAKRMEAELVQAQKMDAVGRLTGGLAHDFNNLLGVVLGNLDVVYERLPEDSQIRDFVRRAVGAADRGAGLVQRLLAFSRKQMLQPVVVDVNELVRDMVGLLRSSLGESVTLETALADGLWPARVDAGQLENTLLNLALNARDAMPEGGVLTVTTRNLRVEPGDRPKPTELVPGDHVALIIRDTGVGMSPEVRERAFEPFFTTKEVGRGTGLGLSMVHGFVKQSGGTVALSSAEGEGTEVTIFLPRAADEDAGARETAA